MGKLTPLGQPFLGSFTTLTQLHPEVESATLRFVESDGSSESRTQYRDLASEGRVACGNPRCNRGGYDLRWQVEHMISRHEAESTINQSCNGDEGSPKGRNKGRECIMSMRGTILIKYKEAPSTKSEAVPTD